MIKEIQAKTLLVSVRQPDPWFGLRHNMNIYRGCEHQCIYCDSRNECYGIEDFRDVLVKTNAIGLLRRELAAKRAKGRIGTGSMSDPYTMVEARYGLTGQALAVLAEFGWPVHIITKSDLVLKDLETLRRFGRAGASVSFTVTTTDDALARKLEPYAPSPSARFAAMRTLASVGLHTGAVMTPVLPFLEDNEENVRGIVERTRQAGGAYIVACFGMTLRDRQRAYYYRELDRLFPGLSRKYEARFGGRYECEADGRLGLERLFAGLCREHGPGFNLIPERWRLL